MIIPSPEIVHGRVKF